MTGLVKRVSKKVSKLSDEQVGQLFDVLTEENEILDSVLESLSTGLIICDENFHILQINKITESYISFSTITSDPKTLEVPVWELIADNEISLFIRNNCENYKGNVCKEFTTETTGGSIKFIVIKILPFIRKGKIVGNIISIDDITEKRKQETLLRRMEGLASLTTLAANVAHEIKNPLGSISIHIQLLQKSIKKARETDGLLPQEKFLEKYISVVNEEIERLNNIVVDFLFAVRPVNADFQLSNPNDLIFQIIEFCEPELAEKNIKIDVGLEKNPPKLLIDNKLFKQVILNLFQNAKAAMPSGGALRISSSIKNDKFILRIADNGEGMDEKTVSRVFEPYFTTKTTGTGLGLTMSYKIIKEFSGDIQVQSVLGEGSVFIITLPIPQSEHKLLEYNKGE